MRTRVEIVWEDEEKYVPSMPISGNSNAVGIIRYSSGNLALGTRIIRDIDSGSYLMYLVVTSRENTGISRFSTAYPSIRFPAYLE